MQFQPIPINFSQSVSVSFNQESRGLLTTGRWGKTTVTITDAEPFRFGNSSTNITEYTSQNILERWTRGLRNPLLTIRTETETNQLGNHRNHPAAKGVWPKEFGQKVTKKVTEASEKVTKKSPKESRKRKKVIELLLPTSFCGTLKKGKHQKNHARIICKKKGFWKHLKGTLPKGTGREVRFPAK